MMARSQRSTPQTIANTLNKV